MASALARIEAAPDEAETLALLDAAYGSPRAHVVGITGPPGVGKSSLVSRLIAAYRAQQRTVGVIAVDPSSRRSGGALLGDRTRLQIAPEDPGVFVRSMASRGRLGGLSALTPAAMVLMRAVYDLVLVETVGVGQAETEVAAVSDSVAFCVQPGSGDSLQYLKAGIAEIPDVAVVTKADLGLIARRTEDDLRAALAQQPTRTAGWSVPVILISAEDGQGIAALVRALAEHHALLAEDGRLEAQREAQAAAWLDDFVREEFGRAGLARAARLSEGAAAKSERAPFARMLALRRELQQHERALRRRSLGASPRRRLRQDLGGACHQRCTLGLGFLHLLQPEQREALAVDARAHLARLAPAQADDGAGRRRRAGEGHRQQSLAHQPAVLHARGQLLADEAALGEVDPVQLLEPALQEGRFLDHQIAAAVGHAEREPQPFIGCTLELLEPELREQGRRGLPRQQRPRAQSGQTRIDEHEALFEHARRARALRQVEQRGHLVADQGGNGEAGADVLEVDLGAQAIHQQPAEQLLEAREFRLEQQLRGFLGDEEIEQELALRRQQGAVTRLILANPRNVVAGQSLEKRTCIAAAHREHAAVGKQNVSGGWHHRAPASSDTP